MIRIVLVSIAGLSILAVVAWLMLAWRERRRRRSRLDRAFSRGRLVQRTGTGVQGKPYNVYGEIFWSDDHQEKP